MCTSSSHTMIDGRNCLCGAYQDAKLCYMRIRGLHAGPPMMHPKPDVTNAECCGKPFNCEKA